MNADAGRPFRQLGRRGAAAMARAMASQRRDGGSTASERLASATGETPVKTGWREIFVQVTAPISGQLGRYSCKSISGKMNAAATGNLSLANLGAIASADDVELWYTGDIGGNAPGALKAGDVLFALAGSVNAAGKIIAIATADRSKIIQKTVVTAVSCVNNQLSVTTEQIWVWDA